MAKEIDKIIISPNAPKSKNVGWFNGKELKLSNNGIWSSVGGGNNNSNSGAQIYSIPPQVIESFKEIEIEGTSISALSLKDAEAIFKESWDVVFKKLSEYTFIVFPPYIPTYYYNPFALGEPLEDSGITMMFSAPEVSASLQMIIMNRPQVFEKDGEKYVMYMIVPEE